MGRSLARPCARICARMSDILLVNRESEDFALKDRFHIVKSLRFKTMSDVLKSIIIRLLLIRSETGEEPDKLKDYDEQLVVYNVALMKDAGFVDARIVPDQNGVPRAAVILRLTWADHDFLDAARDATIWIRAKDKVLKPGVSWAFSMLMEFLKAEAKAHLIKAGIHFD